jgi:hypothetical protein
MEPSDPQASPATPAAGKPQYYVEAGVRRSVAAREAGRADIPAIVYEPGKAPVATRIPLDQLHSPKQVVLRDFRYVRFSEYPTLVLKTEPPLIHVQPLGLPGQSNAIPLAQVALV